MQSVSVADPGEGPAPHPRNETKLRPEGPKKNFFETGLPLSSPGLDDRTPSLSEGLDPPLIIIYGREHKLMTFTLMLAFDERDF